MNAKLLLFACIVTISSCGSQDASQLDDAVIAVGNDPGHFNPGITTAAHVHAVADSLYNGLVALDDELRPVPDLAIAWDVEDDARTYVFHLADGVPWHDGESTCSRRATSSDIPQTSRRWGRVLFGCPLHRRDDHIVLVRNESYFKPGLPYLDELIFRVIPDDSTRLLALKNGEVDYVGTVRPSDAGRLRDASDDAFTVVSTPSGPGGGNCVMTWILSVQTILPIAILALLAPRAVPVDSP